MGINDPIIMVIQTGEEKPYYLRRGKETFFVKCDDAEDPQHYKVQCWNCDHLDEHIRFETRLEAVEWSEETLGATPFDHLPEGVQEINMEEIKEAFNKPKQRRLI